MAFEMRHELRATENKLRNIFAALLLLCCCFVSSQAFSGQSYRIHPDLECVKRHDCAKLPEGSLIAWDKDKELLKSLQFSNGDHCNDIFKILWAWSKRGNLEARYNLVAQMSAYAGAAMILPGPSYDYLTNQRRLIIISVHTTGVDFGAEKNEWLDKRFINVPMLGTDSGFGRCLQKSRHEQCVQDLVETGKIPSFKAFAEEIDLFVGAGYQAHCPGLALHSGRPQEPLDRNTSK